MGYNRITMGNMDAFRFDAKKYRGWYRSRGVSIHDIPAFLRELRDWLNRNSLEVSEDSIDVLMQVAKHPEPEQRRAVGELLKSLLADDPQAGWDALLGRAFVITMIEGAGL